jgi:hypothetical protein
MTDTQIRRNTNIFCLELVVEVFQEEEMRWIASEGSDKNHLANRIVVEPGVTRR